jgi:hypothetical protein
VIAEANVKLMVEYLAIRHGRLGSQFVYELLLDPNAPEAVAHIGLIDVEKLRHGYNNNVAGGAANLADFSRGVAGQNGHLAGGGENLAPPATQFAAAT